jgi:hypothetical protein
MWKYSTSVAIYRETRLNRKISTVRSEATTLNPKHCRPSFMFELRVERKSDRSIASESCLIAWTIGPLRNKCSALDGRKWYKGSNLMKLEVTDALIFRGSRSVRYVVDRSSVDVVSKHHKSMYAICSESGCKKNLNHVYCSSSSRQQTISQKVTELYKLLDRTYMRDTRIPKKRTS